jgi:hypothetical protein
MILWFLDIELTHAAAQGASLEPEDFSRTVLSAYFPMGLLKHPNNMVSIDRFHEFNGYMRPFSESVNGCPINPFLANFPYKPE